MSTKGTSFHSFVAFFCLLEKTETLDKKGDTHIKKDPAEDPNILNGTHLGTMQLLESCIGCLFAAQQPTFQTLVGRRNWGKMEEPGLTLESRIDVHSHPWSLPS